jgi:hypothetical protein
VVHDNKVTKNYGVNQFQSKRYPDEDATNPFEGQGGGTLWDFYGTFWDIYGTFWDIYGTFWDFYIQPFQGQGGGTFLGTFTSNPFQGQGCEHLRHLLVYIKPFSGTKWWDI